MRRHISATGTGFEKSSYSLQYSQERLQRRMGIMWASTGCWVEARPHPIMRHSFNRVSPNPRALRPRVPLVIFLIYPDLGRKCTPAPAYSIPRAVLLKGLRTGCRNKDFARAAVRSASPRHTGNTAFHSCVTFQSGHTLTVRGPSTFRRTNETKFKGGASSCPPRRKGISSPRHHLRFVSTC